METVKLTIEAIRVNMKLTRPEMAEKMNVNIDRYNRLATGESKMLATELARLHEISNVPWESIDYLNK